ncbi:MAG: UDP-N-acetylmuramate--L-alanine ligase [Elusimicrobiota bacterium]
MFKKIKNVHFIGIGGSGMSGIAEVLLKLGYHVSGSDMSQSAVSKRLEELGARVFIGHKAAHILGADVVVTSTAISKTNPEVIQAHKKNIPVIPRIEMLAEIARLKYTIAIAGTHGKTTTTSLVGQILSYCAVDPTVIVGGRLKAVGTGGVLGSGDYLVAEADESDGSFLHLSPTISVITNIDDDHLDYYKTMERLESAFIQFADYVPFYGCTYVCGEDKGIKRVLSKMRRRTQIYGFDKKYYLSASKIKLTESGSTFEVFLKGKKLGSVTLPLSGKHNVLNSLAAIAVALHIDLPFQKIAEALSQFRGVGRRIELKGEARGIVVVDDYGHHPTEIKATLSAIRGRWPKKRLVVLFQPHRYTRTQILAKQFAEALSISDQLLLLPIYPAGEKPIKGVSSQSISKFLKKKNWVQLNGHPDYSTLSRFLKSGDVLLTLGAGDVWKVGEQFLHLAVSLGERIKLAFPSLSERVKCEEPLSRHSTWAIGGPAEVYMEVHSLKELQYFYKWCLTQQVPVFFLGWGSNILIPDEGLRGVVIRLRGDFESINIKNESVTVGAGVHLPKLAKATAEEGLSGVEALAGVPGTIGGALMTNAGTQRGVIGDVIETVTLFLPNGNIKTLTKDQIKFEYRNTSLKGSWVVSATLKLKSKSKEETQKNLMFELDYRSKTQPLGTKNVGSIFRNPPGDHAARLIEAAGLKGKVWGKMRVSPKHANFIENMGGGTAKESKELMILIQDAVKEKFQINLHPEVILVEQPQVPILRD